MQIKLENPAGYRAVSTLPFLKDKSVAVGDYLSKVLPSPLSATKPEIKRLLEMEWDYPLRGGKRMRPALCMLTNEMLGGSDEKALPTACAIELLHNFFLVHDDIEDESDLRRGKPALHKLHGTAHAVNVGDSLFTRVWQILVENKNLLGATTSFKVMREFIRQCTFTVEGQAMEIDWVQQNRFDMSEKDYLDMVEHKTAHYTITTPMRIGAIIAGMPSKFINSLDKPGLKLGTAFQIQDDVLNLIATEAEMGKEVGGDLLEGKRTLIFIHCMKKAKEADKQFLTEFYSKPRSQKTEAEAKRAIEIIRSTGSIEYSQKTAKKLAEDSKTLLAKRLQGIPDSNAKRELFSLVDYAVTRSY